MSTSIAQLSEKLQQLLIEEAQELGRSSGFVKRERKFSGASFAQTLIFGWQANPQASLEDLCQSARTCGVSISAQGLQERMNSPQAAQFMGALLGASLEHTVTSPGSDITFIEQFNGIYVQDSTLVQLPNSLRDIWSGCGEEQSSLKIQTVLNYQQGHLNLTLAHGRAHDGPLQTVILPQRSLRLADTAYFKVTVFEQLNEQGVYWLTRIPGRVGIVDDGSVVKIGKWLAQQSQDCIDISAHLTAQQLPCRLIAVRVPPNVVAQRQQRAYANDHKRSYPVTATTLALCEWTVIATNLPPQQLSVQQALLLLRLRWQIELLFKLWKKEFFLTTWRSQRPLQILCEVYAKLVLVVIQHWCLLVGCWHLPDRSLVKAVSVLRKHAFHLASVLPVLDRLQDTLTLILATLERCLVKKRRSRPATFQLLVETRPLS